MLTPTEINKMEVRANAATAGPWRIGHINAFEHADIDCEDGTIAQVQSRRDQAFIASARTDIPRLIAEIRRLYGIIGTNVTDPKR